VLFPSHTGVIEKTTQSEDCSVFSPHTDVIRRPHNQRVQVISPSHTPTIHNPRPTASHHPSSSTPRHLPTPSSSTPRHLPTPSSSTPRHLPTPLIYHPPPTTPNYPHASCLANKPPNPLLPSTTKSIISYAPTSPVPKLSSIASKKVNLTNRFRRERE
jgi:hypothetical protein